jgi:CRISPR-associated endonuclease/helicase Cas3
LAWVVNRRVVVDQVTAEVEDLCKKWPEIGFEPLPNPPAVSTLRGQLADKGDWLRDPNRPAIVVGTVDMIGSRLLFRGYRSGPYWRPIEAGLLGVDTLVVNDEAHLSPAFAKLLGGISAMRPAEQVPSKSFRYILLSATQSDEKGEEKVRFEHNPEEDATESERFCSVWTASKRLELREVANGPAVKAEMWKIATQNAAARTIVFIDKPEEALEFFKRLTNDGFAAELMTGTMRGHERDKLVDSENFQRFQRPDPGGEPVFLVATSAGEVGVNLTCERMVTELREADHLIQRFGRMNRFGFDSSGQALQGKAWVVYVTPKKESQVRLRATLDYLQSLEDDVSPQKLWSNRPPDDARMERPKTARLEFWRIESWAQTTYRDRYMPPVEPWLHGQDNDEPRTEVAWRADLEHLLAWEVPDSAIEKILDAFPILAKEKLQEPSSRVLDKLKKIAEKLDGQSDRVVIVDRDQSVTTVNILSLTEERIRYRLVLLPEHIGRVEEHGMFEPERGEGSLTDVASNDKRVRLVFREGKWQCLGSELDALPQGSSRRDISDFANENDFRAPLIIKNPADESDEMLVYLTKRSEKKKFALREVGLDEHLEAVARRARQIALAVGLSEDLAARYFEAGRLHDEGKDHRLWQTAMGAKNWPAAKTVAAANPALLNGYRHEFGSLMKAIAAGKQDELTLHLIAAHHASGRPFFKPDQFDPLQREEDCKHVAREAEQRFGRLQAQFGPWGLAYLEAIFKRADGLVSADEGDGASE